MVLVPGTLLDAMKTANSQGIGQAVLLIDEQGEKLASAYMIAYQSVISLAKTLRLPLIFIGTITPGDLQINSSLQTAASGADLLTLWKKQPNAFADTNLDDILKIKQVKEIVVMGFRTNCCVRQTSIGSTKEDEPNYFIPGAVQKGYCVKTNHLVVRDFDAANWVDAPGVTFYKQLGGKGLPTPPPKKKPAQQAGNTITTPNQDTGTGAD